MKIKHFVLTVACLLIALIANAQTKITIDSIEYDVSGPEAVVLKVNQKRDTVVIPESIEVDGYTLKVTTIGSYAMQSVPAKRVVALCIKRLNNLAFYNASYIKDVKFRDLETIGNEAFSWCTSLSNIDFGNKLQSIGDYLFGTHSGSMGYGIKYLVFPATLNQMGKDPFSGIYLYMEKVFRTIIYLGRNFGAESLYIDNLPKKLQDSVKVYRGRDLVNVKDSQAVVYTGKTPRLSVSYTLPTYFQVIDSGFTSLKKDAGAYQDSITVTYGNDFMTFQVKKPCNYAISEAPLSITANNQSKNYGEENPKFTVRYDGFVNGEDSTVLSTLPEVTSPAIKTSDAGEYDITAKGAVAKNYHITYIGGKLSVSKRLLNAIAVNSTRIYGEPNPKFDVKYDGFVLGENESVLTKLPLATTEASPLSDVGTYPISVSGGEAKNYDFIYADGVLTIEKAKQAITWNQDLSNVEQYSQIELSGQASSKLPITYTLDNDTVCSIQIIGDKTYLDCFGTGKVVIAAKQLGNGNYYPTTKSYKLMTVVNTTGISTTRQQDVKNRIRISHGKLVVEGMNADDVLSVYTLSGQTIYRGKNTEIQLPAGSYIVRIGTYAQKFIIR